MSAIYFEIQADDVKQASGFYRAVFGWKFFEVKGFPIPYWHIETGSGSEGGLLKRPGNGLRRNAARMPLFAPSRSTISIESRRKY